MELRFEKDNLLKSVQILQGVASSKGVLLILSNILVTAQDGRIEMSATDLEVGTRILVDGEVIEPGGITVPAGKMSELVRELPPSEVKFSTYANDRMDFIPDTERRCQ